MGTQKDDLIGFAFSMPTKNAALPIVATFSMFAPVMKKEQKSAFARSSACVS